MNPSLLVVDDEIDILESLVEEFSEAYRVTSATNGVKALEQMQKEVPDLVLLDISMPEMDGIELCKRMRESETMRDVQVLFISARRELSSVLSAFEVGADDFIEKPFHLEELRARVAARLRRKTAPKSEEIVVGNITLSPRAMSVTVGKKPVEFSSLEYHLLKFFMENSDRVVKREEILAAVWQGEAISARTIDAHLVSVRRRIAKATYEIASMYGEGYIFRQKRRGSKA